MTRQRRCQVGRVVTHPRVILLYSQNGEAEEMRAGHQDVGHGEVHELLSRQRPQVLERDEGKDDETRSDDRYDTCGAYHYSQGEEKRFHDHVSLNNPGLEAWHIIFNYAHRACARVSKIHEFYYKLLFILCSIFPRDGVQNQRSLPVSIIVVLSLCQHLHAVPIQLSGGLMNQHRPPCPSPQTMVVGLGTAAAKVGADFFQQLVANLSCEDTEENGVGKALCRVSNTLFGRCVVWMLAVNMCKGSM